MILRELKVAKIGECDSKMHCCQTSKLCTLVNGNKCMEEYSAFNVHNFWPMLDDKIDKNIVFNLEKASMKGKICSNKKSNWETYCPLKLHLFGSN